MFFQRALLIAIIALYYCAITVKGQCPQVSSPCQCSSSIYEPVVIVCDAAGSLQSALGSLGNVRQVQINSLVITNTPIQSLPDFAFQGFTINRLVLNRNSLSQIGQRAFDGFLNESLTELDLKDNLLGQIPQTGIPSLRRLRTLILARNRIQRLPSRPFANYESRDYLSKIDLSGNQLTLVEPTVFSGLTNLEEVSLEANQLTVVPTSAFSEQRGRLKNLNLGLNRISNVSPGQLDFPNLESLSLEFNGITTLVPDVFRQVPKLLYLYITGNKFPRWDPEMFRYVGALRILGIGETPIRTIPQNAFQYIPSLIRLEMSEAAVDNIDNGAFQRVPNIQAIIMNKNRLTRIRQDMFQSLTKLYTLDLSGNQLNQVDDRAWANLPSLRHLDISSNNLQVLPPNVFQNTFLPTADTRVLYLCDNPWVCDERLDWLRQWLRQNMDIVIDKATTCMAVCRAPTDLDNWPLRQPNPDRPPTAGPILPQNEGLVTSNIGWIILAVILAILLASILLLAIARYFVSRRRKKEKEQEEERIISSPPASAAPSIYPASAVDIDLPPATNFIYDVEEVAPPLPPPIRHRAREENRNYEVTTTTESFERTIHPNAQQSRTMMSGYY